jgi:hypothetical protein
VHRKRRGQALIIALGLILGLTLLVSASQLVTVTEMKRSRGERDFERALQYAEAGLNAYLNRLGNGDGTGTYSGLVPPFQSLPEFYSVDGFRAAVDAGTITSQASTPYRFVHYPSGSTDSGFYVGHVGTPGSFATLVAYGYCRGAVRRVRGTGRTFSIFDWAAIWGLNPGTTNQDYAWKFSGSANVVGAAGAEGLFSGSNNVTVYDGPILWANGSYGAPYNNPTLTIQASSNGVPTGHPDPATYSWHSHSVAVPGTRYLAGKLDFPTADEVAEDHGATGGVSWFKTNNDNATGLRYLVKHDTTGVIRELSGSYTVLGNNDYQLDNELSPNASTLRNLGIAADETLYGVRIYPGDYYFESISMGNADRITLRTYTDAERSIAVDSSRIDRRSIAVVDDAGAEPANPNSGESDSANVRIWIGKTNGQNDPNTTFDTNTEMEYPKYASRFRIYSATRGSFTVRGRNTVPPPPFRVNLLAYNTSNGAGYGNVSFVSSTYLFGSLIAWTVDVSGGTTIEKEAPELGPDDRLTYVLDYWTELD